MKNKTIIAVGLIVLAIAGAVIYKFNFTNGDIFFNNGKQINTHDGTYTVNGQKITLKNGTSETPTVTSPASKIITKYFGNEVKHDLNGDGILDSVFIITQETGGSGIFYYVVARINATSGPIGSDAVLLGDRIAPQTTEIDESNEKVNVIVVNYAVRKAGEPMTTSPSVGKSIWLKLDTKTMQFGEVAQNFEGEADPARMTLDMKTWAWTKTLYSDDKLVTPKITGKFTITFKKDGTFSATTDCNGVGGEYAVNKNQITFTSMMSTLMYCEGSQENEFRKMIEQTQSYMFTSKGEMVLLLKYDSGSVIFK